ncbi:MAG: RIO1 family regulatory kinase/ATPase [Acidimicrobiales bacterium]|nr:RIO1 family regulatory kinase/ATPase [Acidimicrobiales bacterium]
MTTQIDTDWPTLVDRAQEGYVDEELGVLKSGKEATVSLVARRLLADGTTVLLARKRYRFDSRFTRRDAYLQGSYAHRADIPMQLRRSEMRSGRALAGWRTNEYQMLGELWNAGARVPYPFEYGEFGDVYMQFLGDGRVAAPRLESLAPAPAQAARWLESLIEDLHRFVHLLLVHADLSPYNVLIHDDTPFIIDLPQAVRIGAAPNAFELLRRDIRNLLDYFERFTDCPTGEEVFADLMRYAPWR